MSDELNGSQLQNYETSSLCFSKDEFFAPNFDLDAFLTRYKREYGLERLHGDLNIYLKVLKTSMSELINKDYADFVNLSTNLVGLEKAINDLKTPLGALKADVENMQGLIDQEHDLLTKKMNEKLAIVKRRIVLKLLINWQRSMNLTNEMLDNDKTKLTGDYIERIAFEFRQLKHSLNICQQDNLTQNDDISKLSSMLENIMEELFLRTYESNDTVQLTHVLKSYILLSKQQLVEQLYQRNYVKVYMDKYINKDFMEANELKLNGVFEKILDFIGLNSQFLHLTNDIRCSNLNSSEAKNSTEFDFIVNSIFSYVVEAFEDNLNEIFSPANPELFHANYKSAMNFLSDFENKCRDCLNLPASFTIRKSDACKTFVKKWSVQIYFQIKFHEIVENFLNNLNQKNAEQFNSSEGSDEFEFTFHLKSTECLLKSLSYCWRSDVFLEPLLSQFWKLNLQMLSRYEDFYRQLVNEQITDDSANDAATSQQTPASIVTTQQINQTEHSVSRNDFKFLVFLLVDLKKLCVKLNNYFDADVAPTMRSCGIKEISFLKEAIMECVKKINELEVIVGDRIGSILLSQVSTYLKSAQEIPRLYRRTNREAPKTASNYIRQALQVFIDFDSEWMKLFEADQFNSHMNSVIDQTCLKYYTISSDLLTSVKKMEDSLKQLKRLRAAPGGDSSANSTQNSSGQTQSTTISDDDKVRLQLYIDVCEFGSVLEEKFKYKGADNFNTLYKLVDEVKSQIDIQIS